MPHCNRMQYCNYSVLQNDFVVQRLPTYSFRQIYKIDFFLRGDTLGSKMCITVVNPQMSSQLLTLWFLEDLIVISNV